tara:strand:- start:321 stop:1016 length:696 start_codon:yes stop_codon:yes gene_type:complete
MSVSFVIPTLNEEENIKNVFDLISQSMKSLSLEWEIIFVDDKSVDNTLVEIQKLETKKVRLIISQKREGLGKALSLGWKNSSMNYVLFLDCDSGISRKDLKNLVSSRKEKTMIVGSRYLKKSKINGAPFTKVFLSKVLNYFSSKILSLNIRDLSHSLRIFPSKFFEINEIYSHPGFFWLQCKVFSKNGYNFEEIPITFNERQKGVTKNKSYKMLMSVLRFFYILISKEQKN